MFVGRPDIGLEPGDFIPFPAIVNMVPRGAGRLKGNSVDWTEPIAFVATIRNLNGHPLMIFGQWNIILLDCRPLSRFGCVAGVAVLLYAPVYT